MIKIFIAAMLISGTCFAIPNANKARKITRLNVNNAEGFKKQILLEQIDSAIESSREFHVSITIADNVSNVTIYDIKELLKKKGYEVRFYDDHTLLIEWEK